MGKIKSVTVGECEVCGAETDIDSPEVCYGCVVAGQGLRVKIEYRIRPDLTVKGEPHYSRTRGDYRWTVLTGLCSQVTGEAMTLAEAEADAREAVQEAYAPRKVATTEKVPF